ncbi:MAG: OmpH family outer membrane protein [Planctomycetota bacterium]
MTNANISARFALTLLAAAAFGLLATAAAPRAQAPGAAVPTARVAVVDVVQAIEQYPLYIKLRSEFAKRMEGFKMQQEGMRQKLDEMRATIAMLDEGTAERDDKQFQFELSRQTAEYQAKAEFERLQLVDMRNTLAAYEDLDFAIGEVAKQKNVQVVLVKQVIRPNPMPIADQKDADVQKRVRAYDSRQVLWASNQVDITSDVIKFMQVPLPSREERVGKAPAGGKPGAGAPAAAPASSGSPKRGS